MLLRKLTLYSPSSRCCIFLRISFHKTFAADCCCASELNAKRDRRFSFAYNFSYSTERRSNTSHGVIFDGRVHRGEEFLIWKYMPRWNPRHNKKCLRIRQPNAWVECFRDFCFSLLELRQPGMFIRTVHFQVDTVNVKHHLTWLAVALNHKFLLPVDIPDKLVWYAHKRRRSKPHGRILPRRPDFMIIIIDICASPLVRSRIFESSQRVREPYKQFAWNKSQNPI